MTSPRHLLKAWNMYPKKALGQNFLEDPSTAEMIVNRSEISSDDIVLEIGPGLGSLTIPIARRAESVYAVELDRDLSKLLETQLLLHKMENVEVINQNILRVDIGSLFERKNRKLVIVGNLPYNISSQILVGLVRSRRYIDHAVLMFQRELARRLVSQPGSKDYGRITVLLQYYTEIDSLAVIKASVFFPRPHVDSEVLSFRFIPDSEIEHRAEDEETFMKIVKAAFGQRRKTLKNALSGSELQFTPEEANALLDKAGIDPSRRAETLTVREFVHLSNQLSTS